jgi:ubiquinone/menaquinone biosynthesis C-methylase UbiE
MTDAVGNVYYGDTASDYEKRRSKSRRWKLENRAVKAYLDQIPKRLSVLDVPFGTGRFMPYYFNRRHHVTGMDVSIDMLNAAKLSINSQKFDGCNMLVGDATDIKFIDETFDLVVSVRFLQNIIPLGDVRIALREMARVCRGRAILQMEIRKEEVARAAPPAENKPMRGGLYERDVRKLLLTAGFEVEDITKVYDHKESDYAILLCRKL